MKTLFKKQKKEIDNKTINEIVLEIHETFDTEVERLLEEARQLVQEDVDHELIDYADKLKEIGFNNSKDAVMARKERQILNDMNRENKKKADTIKAINYFSQKYPHYKFITKESIIKICGKYGLVYGESSKYIGDVPKDKVEVMLNFKIDKKDYAYSIMKSSQYTREPIIMLVSFDEGTKLNKYNPRPDDRYRDFKKKSFIIAAPLKDFDKSNMEVKDFELVKNKVPIPDPVVMQPVLFENNEYYLIVTAWGEEASDEEVVNHNMN